MVTTSNIRLEVRLHKRRDLVKDVQAVSIRTRVHDMLSATSLSIAFLDMLSEYLFHVLCHSSVTVLSSTHHTFTSEAYYSVGYSVETTTQTWLCPHHTTSVLLFFRCCPFLFFSVFSLLLFPPL